MNHLQTILQQAVALHRSGAAQQARALYQQVLSIEPKQADALNLLGVLTLQDGSPEEAISLIRQSVAIRPGSVDTLNNLGSALRRAGCLTEAKTVLCNARKMRPDHPDVLNNLGNVLRELGEFTEAIRCYRESLTLKPAVAETLNNLGIALKDSGMLMEALDTFQAAIDMQPDYPYAHNNKGTLLRDLGKPQEALGCFKKALTLKADFLEALVNLGYTLRSLGEMAGSLHCFEQALLKKPDLPSALRGSGLVHAMAGNLDTAIALLKRALEPQPHDPDTLSNLGNVLKDQGALGEALQCYRQALKHAPQRADIHSNIVFTNLFFHALEPDLFLAEARRWDVTHGLVPGTHATVVPADDTLHTKLRIGYLSPDFVSHCQALFMVPLLRSHHKEVVEVYCYSDVTAPDAITSELRGYADVWREVCGKSDAAVVELIRSDRIDIMVDLTMHMARNRLKVFAQRVAPVQVCWLAYPGTTGLSAMDFRLTDPLLDPPGTNDQYYSEKSIRLADTFWCYDPLATQPVVSGLPAFSQGYVTFGCLNNFCKVTDEMYALWLDIMQQVPDSRLVLLSAEGHHRQRLVSTAVAAGVAATRIIFVNKVPRNVYLELYNTIDIGLDTFPVNGHTTSLDSYWMGVPVITRYGATPVSRAGLCHLTHLDMQELIAHSPEEYVSIAVALAADLPRLETLRRTLRNRLEKSALMDSARFASAMEVAYRSMWREYWRT